MFGRKKKVKLTEEMKAYYLYHYGTTDVDYVCDMLAKLKFEKTFQRVSEFVVFYNIPKEEQYNIIKRNIKKFAALFGIAENTKVGNNPKDKQLSALKKIYGIDVLILTKQLEEKGYSKEDATRIVENSYPFSVESVRELRSLKIEDYDIVDGKLVMKLEKDIFERYNKEHQTQEIKPEEKAL